MQVNDPVYARGVAYLLRTQYANGGWFVKTRAFPVQPQFESGFPFGYHQWISSAATSWASLAIAYTLPDAGRVARPSLALVPEGDGLRATHAGTELDGRGFRNKSSWSTESVT